MEAYSRVRSIKLKRKSIDQEFGFSIRGGFEHGTGIFVSTVLPKSIAHRQGIRAGDQILRVNGYPASIAIHQECLIIMRIQTSLHLKVRSVGMIPVREEAEIPLTWRLVEHKLSDSLLEQISDSPPSINKNNHMILDSRLSENSEFHGQEVKVYINTNNQSGLGCCICKGPPERVGIYVQSTKADGVAREAGLRPGDQILHCNGVSFQNIPFAEAVFHLKSSKELRLRVIKGAASDLFPGESSGYNSSASSLNGETITTHVSVGSESSSTTDESYTTSTHTNNVPYEIPKRLSIVTEEHSPTNSSDEKRNNQAAVSLDRDMEWEEIEKVWSSSNISNKKGHNNPKKESIIIEVKGEDASGIHKNSQTEQARLLIEERKKIEAEHKKLAEEALRLESEKLKFEKEKKAHESNLKLQESLGNSRSSSVSSNESTRSNISNNNPPNHYTDLAGALNGEILKRSQRRENKSLDENEPTFNESNENRGSTTAPFTVPIDDDKRRQHELLIEEFKRAHRKMFANSIEESKSVNHDESKSPHPLKEERASFRAKRIQKEVDHAKKMVENSVAGIVRQRLLRIERQHQEVQETEREVTKRVINKKAPPPPPPMVQTPIISQTGTNNSEKGNSDNSKFEASIDNRISNLSINDNVNEVRPPSPSPDYSNSPSPELGRKNIYSTSQEYLLNTSTKSMAVHNSTGGKNNNVPFSQPHHYQRHNNYGKISGGILKNSTKSSYTSSEHASTHNGRTIKFEQY